MSSRAEAPFINACENQTAPDALVLTGRAHLAAAIALDDRLVTGGTTGAASIGEIHGLNSKKMEIEQGGFSGTCQPMCRQQPKFDAAGAFV